MYLNNFWTHGALPLNLAGMVDDREPWQIWLF